MIDRAVILAAGSAERIQRGIENYIMNRDELSAVRLGEKMAARFGRFPFLDYQVLNLIQAGLKRINIVLKPDDRFFTAHYNRYGGIIFPEAAISFSYQEIPDGTARAVFAAEPFINNERFILLNGDNNYSAKSIGMLLNTPEECSAMIAYDTDGFNEWTKKRIQTFAVIRTFKGKLKDIVEKAWDPQQYETKDILYGSDNERIAVDSRVLTSMNMWCFTPDILGACRDVKRHEPRKEGKEGEFELPDAVKLMMKRGREVRVYYVCEDVLDLTRAEDIEVIEKQIQEKLTDKIDELEKRYRRLRGS